MFRGCAGNMAGEVPAFKADAKSESAGSQAPGAQRCQTSG